MQEIFEETKSVNNNSLLSIFLDYFLQIHKNAVHRLCKLPSAITDTETLTMSSLVQTCKNRRWLLLADVIERMLYISTEYKHTEGYLKRKTIEN